MNIQDVREWQEHPVTKEFFNQVQLHLVDADRLVHRHLAENQLNEAALFNAGMEQIKEILEIPEGIIDDIKEDN